MKEVLIFCFDGTCNDPGDAGNYAEDQSVTNILKLHVLFGGNLRRESKKQTYSGAFQNNDNLHQQSFYYRGVGTYGGRFRKFINTTSAPEHLLSDVKKILNAAIKDLKAANEDLKKHYQKDSYVDTHVLVFGFSRGAALARRFAAVAKQRSGIKGLKIDFLGVFDTVAATSSYSRGLGIDLSPETKPSSSVVYETPTIGNHVRKVVHLVALDENRTTFQPTLFNYANCTSDRITEVWFPGVHSDVGGGYWYDGLSDLALEYMIEKVKQECVGYGVRISNPKEATYDQLTIKKCNNDKDDMKITKDDIKRKALVNGTLHEHKRKTISIAVAVIVGIIAGAVAGIAAGIAIGMATGIATGVVAGAVTGIAIGVIAGVAIGIATDMVTGIATGAIAGAVTSITTFMATYVIAGVMVSAIIGIMVSAIAGAIVSAIVGVIVGVMVGKYTRKKRLHPREVRIAGDHPECKYPMVHESVQLRYKKVKGYRPHALRGAQYVVTGNGRQCSEAEQKDPDHKYVVTAYDDRLGDVRQGASGLGAVQQVSDTI